MLLLLTRIHNHKLLLERGDVRLEIDRLEALDLLLAALTFTESHHATVDLPIPGSK